MPNYSILDRKIIKISGPDAKEFLQGLTTNDINSLTTENPLIYSLMLSATGTFFCDFFISQKKGDIYLDVEEARIAEIFKKLSLYKLSADIELEIIDDLKIVFLDQKITEINSYQDPRSKEISFRAILDQNNLEKIQNSPDSVSYTHLTLPTN